MRRTWIKIKRGLLEPKHRVAIGEAWQLYFYILNIVNWETGTYEEWKDEAIAADLDMPLPTLRYQRKRLVEKGYISVEKMQHTQRIIVHNWTNPREYSGEVYNKRQSNNESDNESNNQSDNQSVNDYEEDDSSFIQSHYTQHTTQLKDNIYTEVFSDTVYEPCDEEGNPIKEKKKKEPKEPTHPAIVAFRRVTGRYPPKTNYDWVISILGDSPDELKMHECKANWDRRGYNGNSLKWVEWYREGVPIQGFKKPDTAHATPDERKAYSEWENQ